MKKQTKIIVGVIIVVAVVILIFSLFYPPTDHDKVSGTFGKADKYRQTQMTEADILLRSEFTQDTDKLHQMITGLIYFTLFTENLTRTIDSCLISFNYQGFDKDPKNLETIRLLKDYNEFLRNNTSTIAQTTRILADIYLEDTTTLSVDIEQNLRDFAVFVTQANEKDSVLMQSLAAMDHFLIGNDKLYQSREEIRKLKEIRDQIVIRSAQFFALTDNKTGLGNMLSYAIQSQEQFADIPIIVASQNIQSSSGLQSVPLSAALQKIISSSDNLSMQFLASSALNAEQTGSQVQSKSELSVIYYDRSSLAFRVESGTQLELSNMVQANQMDYAYLGFIKGIELCAVMDVVLYCGVLQSEALSSHMSAGQLNDIIPAAELSVLGPLGSKEQLQKIQSIEGMQSFLSVYIPMSEYLRLAGTNFVNGYEQ